MILLKSVNVKCLHRGIITINDIDKIEKMVNTFNRGVFNEVTSIDVEIFYKHKESVKVSFKSGSVESASVFWVKAYHEHNYNFIEGKLSKFKEQFYLNHKQ